MANIKWVIGGSIITLIVIGVVSQLSLNLGKPADKKVLKHAYNLSRPEVTSEEAILDPMPPGLEDAEAAMPVPPEVPIDEINPSSPPPEEVSPALFADDAQSGPNGGVGGPPQESGPGQ
ncbi:hypothetical protein DU002_12950 [Corallincola holothuriorum]|uniref:Uncharacterized protein n=1 Tax=Corallincola holothuriorum TaxID=2282215 RepID=A0A368NIP0_9GAMM|nr:hypothetical protein [Corallincola holothuriorum]RCU49251.1 hypothetical protein DU002_12950 [Corallincola holothuriorum]